MIDYERMKKSGPRLKSMLTRAERVSDPKERYLKVKAACTAAVREWNAVGAWIDDWSRWQRALDDAFSNMQRFDPSATSSPEYCPRTLEELA